MSPPVNRSEFFGAIAADSHFRTVAGFVLAKRRRLPKIGDASHHVRSHCTTSKACTQNKNESENGFNSWSSIEDDDKRLTRARAAVGWAGARQVGAK